MELLKIGDRTVKAEAIMPLLGKFGLLPRLIQEVVIDGALEQVELSPEEAKAAEAEFCKRNQINSAEEAKAWAQQRYSTPELIRILAVREKRLAKFKHTTFENEIESYFLKRKSRLDRVLYSLIRTQQAGLAQELYFRVNDDGQSFADLARQYSEGQEAKTGGLIGPVELSVPHPNLAGLLSISQPGQIWPPKRIGEWYVVVRLEKFFPAKMDDAMRQRLMDELFQQWLKEQFQQTPISLPSANAATTPSPVPTPVATAPQPTAVASQPASTTSPPPKSSVETAVAASESSENSDPDADPWS
ncbi:MAG: peptidylprolyl isomerase [Cyanobacteria bacterium J06559_3]